MNRASTWLNRASIWLKRPSISAKRWPRNSTSCWYSVGVMLDRYRSGGRDSSASVSIHRRASLSRPPRSDHAVAAKRVELGLAQAQQLAVHLRVVLAEQRGPHHLRRRLRQLHRVARHRVRSAPGMLELGDEARRLEVRVGEDLLRVEHRAAGHARTREDRGDLLLAAPGRPRLDGGIDLVDELHAVAPVG